MIFLATIPLIIYLTFQQLITSGFPSIEHEARGFLGWCFLVFVGVFISAIISLVPIGIAAWIGSIPPRYGVKDHDYPLVTLREKDGAVGSFFLGSGFISDRQYYFWYRRNDDGSISGGKTYREPGVSLFERDGPAFMRTYKTAYRWPPTEAWLWIVGLDMRESMSWCDVFYIPSGSVKEGYSL